ncbi:hypothetical protein [Marinibactrum halimedae]|uniref:Uncharacterized protein n=1 Tax=Marinibactrum halimedae TaxID=1444977 RepID=A0AA37WKG3_9GAMM|nr:hypothetical protein [Marinibactrum halimedae]MCD9457679.1 hypothetical protein [Marinibactrum halimedae]GLS24948.1 hypothetical protein GCM10007877_06620 [Marinibactrum halimedae]
MLKKTNFKKTSLKKPYLKKTLKKSLFMALSLQGIALQALSSAAYASLSEPDNVFYGRVQSGLQMLSADDTDYHIEARLNGAVIDTYTMGAQFDTLGDHYALRIPMDSTGARQTGVARVGDTVEFYLLQSGANEKSLGQTILADRGNIVSLNLSTENGQVGANVVQSSPVKSSSHIHNENHLRHHTGNIKSANDIASQNPSSSLFSAAQLLYQHEESPWWNNAIFYPISSAALINEGFFQQLTQWGINAITLTSPEIDDKRKGALIDFAKSNSLKTLVDIAVTETTPSVHETASAVVKEWLDLGVDGFRFTQKVPSKEAFEAEFKTDLKKELATIESKWFVSLLDDQYADDAVTVGNFESDQMSHAENISPEINQFISGETEKTLLTYLMTEENNREIKTDIDQSRHLGLHLFSAPLPYQKAVSVLSLLMPGAVHLTEQASAAVIDATHPLHHTLKQAITLRQQQDVFHSPDAVHNVNIHDHVWMSLHRKGEEVGIVLMNTHSEESVVFPAPAGLQGAYTNLINDERYFIHKEINLSPSDIVVLKVMMQ